MSERNGYDSYRYNPGTAAAFYVRFTGWLNVRDAGTNTEYGAINYFYLQHLNSSDTLAEFSLDLSLPPGSQCTKENGWFVCPKPLTP